jgi:hypothetical protein
VKAPTRETVAGRAYLDLQKLGRKQGRQTHELFSLYVLEGFLRRLSGSPLNREFVLKGGVLLAAFEARRPTRDIDFHVRGLENDRSTVLSAVQQVLAVEHDDGIRFDPASARAEIIREEEEYSGVRVESEARLLTARIPFHIDVNFGDPVWPAPQVVSLPLLLGGSLSVRGYPLSMVLAEKLVTALQRGTTTTRWRDFADLFLLCRGREVSGRELQRSLRTVAEHREVSLAPLVEALMGMEVDAQLRWKSWLSKQRLDDRLPAQFGELLKQIISFADPALVVPDLNAQWMPAAGAWVESRRGSAV